MKTSVTAFADTASIIGWIQDYTSYKGEDKRIAGLEIIAKTEDGTATNINIHLNEAQLRLLCQAHNIIIEQI